jgi:putative ATP-dependent endonuclease of the OLD family
VPWNDLDQEKKKKKISQCKSRLNEQATKAMTIDMLNARDPQEDLKKWLLKIAELCA